MRISLLLFILLFTGCSGESSGWTFGGDRVATWCDHGNRIYVHTKGLAVVPSDPTCRKE